ncbi:MAG: RICIN domain-containing protein, partial [Acutalibacteraceae bacterium]
MSKLIRRAVPFLLAFAVILSIMPIVTIQPAQAGTNDKFLAAWNKAPTVTANIHAALVGNALNASGLTKADGGSFNTYNRDTLAGEIAALPWIQSKAMDKYSCPTDNITYIVYGSGSFLGFLRNGVIRYGSGYYKELSRASDLTLNFNTAYYLIETTSDATITGVSVSELSDTGYRVTCYFSTTDGIGSVYFPTWSAKNPDNKVWDKGELNTTTNSATYYVDISKHNYEFGTYFTHIYAYSGAVVDGNAEVCNNKDTKVTVPSLNLSDDFYAFINIVGTPVGDDYPGYAVDCAGKTLSATTDGTTNSTNNVRAEAPDYTDQKQIWHFIKQSDGYYYIRNESYGNPIYLHASGNNVCATAATSLDDNYKWGISINTDVDGKANFNKLTCYYLTTKTVHDSNGGTVLNAHAATGGGYVNLNTKNKDRNEAFFIYNIYDVRTDIPVTIQSLYDINKTNTNTRLGATSDGTDVQYITAASSSDFAARREQMWMFERVNGENEQPAKYRIKNVETGKYLQSDSDKENQNEVYLKDKNDTEGQQWLLLGTSLNETLLVPLSYAHGRSYTYYCNNISANHWNRTDAIQGLNATDGKTGNESTSLYTDTDDFTDAMRWKIAYARYPVEDLGDFYTSIRASIEELYAISLSKDGNNSDGTAYPTYNNNTVAGVKLRRASDNPAVDQQWYFKYLGDGLYNIQNLATGAYLYKNEGTIRAHENCGNDDAAKWYVVREPNGHYSLSNKTDFANPIEIPYAQISGDEQGLRYYEENSTAAQCWVLDVNNKTSPLKGENLGDTFWAYIQSVAVSDSYLHCGDTYNPADGVYDAKMYCKVPQNDAEKKQQENYWKFERHNDGSYTISSCNVQNSVLDRRNGNNGFGSEQDVSIWESNNGYGQRWFIRKCADGKYQLESKLDGKVLTLISTGSYVRVHNPDINNDYKLFNIIPKIDMGIDADLPNVTMRLFNYGRAINSADGAVLPFFNGAKDSTSYVDTDNNSAIDSMIDIKPTMCSTLVDGYPFVENNNISDSNTTNDFGRSFKNKRGSLQYLFDSNMGADTNGFVKGNQGNAQNPPTSYDLPSSDYVQNSNYQSQRFNVNDPASLFKKNAKTGLYYYDSLLNAAYFNRDKDSSGNYLTSGNFILYDYTMSVPKAGSGFTYQSGQNTVTGISVFNGNFFPFNIAHQEGFVSYGDSNSNNRPLIPETNDYVTKGDYVPVNYSLDGNTPLDCWFGVTLESYFEQPKNGMSEGKPVQFNFKGDDDVWVYVDDVLVLDIGGTHQSLSASIDFSTGEVTYPKDTKPNENTTTTLKALFQAATKQDGTKLYDSNYIAANFTGDTFTSGTKHRLNFFYMERGGVVSYCKINFNLPKGEPIITKQVDGVTDENKDCYYKFRLTGYESKANSSKNASDYTDREAVNTTDI